MPRAAEPTLGERVLQADDGQASSRSAGVGPAVALPSARAIVSAPPLPSPAWVDRTVEISHLSLYPGMLAYDPAISATVEYDGYFGTTWAYTATGWTNITPAVSPPPRIYGGLAYDAAFAELVLFGGYSIRSGAPLNDTWVFHGGAWTNETSAVSPSPRYSVGFAADPMNAGVLLYGGFQNVTPDPASNQTWIWNASGWHDLPGPPGLPPIWGGAIAYDSVDQQEVAFGGSNVVGGVVVLSNQTWTYANGAWTNRTTAGPGPRTGASMADYPTLGGVALFGGTNGSALATTYNDTWVFHNNAWSLVLGGVAPDSRAFAGFAWDTATGDAVLDGGLGPHGVDGSEFHLDTWTFRAGAWSEVQGNYTPDDRAGEGFAPVGGAGVSAVLFGGINATGAYGNDSWSFTHDTWVEHLDPAAPPARTESMFASDPADGYDVLFGGSNRTEVFNDTWSYSSGQWTDRSGPAAPQPRQGGVFVYDPVIGEDLLFGGRSASNRTLNDTWTYHGGTWTEMFPTVVPPARAFATAAYDHALQGVVVFGGASSGSTLTPRPLNDTWLYTNGTWTQLSTPVAPSPRYASTMEFDPRLQSLVLFGGWTYPNSPYADNDTWTYGANGWQRFGVHGALPPAGFAVTWWDPTTNATWMYGGAALNLTSSTASLSSATLALDLLGSNVTLSGSGGSTPYRWNYSASARDGAAPYQYSWSLPGATGSGASGSYTFDTPGTYVVRLNLTDAWGVVWNRTYVITVVPGPLLVSFTSTPSSGSAPLLVTFAATAQGASPPFAYSWDFGNGETAPQSPDPNASTTYVHNGTYTVTLNVSSGNVSATHTESVPLISLAPFQIQASVSPSHSTPPLNISFSANPLNGTPPFAYDWTFEGGGNSSKASGYHVFDTAAVPISVNYTLSVNVTDGNGTVVGETFRVYVLPYMSVPGSPSNRSSPAPGIPDWAWVLVGIAVLGAVAAVVLLRRRTPPAGGEASAGAATSPMPWDEGDTSGTR
jgi:hypothetical protein